jgi:predicted  nucleic acid-binding Zn-ribbon protein
MSEECKDCPYQLTTSTTIEKLERDVDNIWSRLRTLENGLIVQSTTMDQLMKSLDEVKDSLRKIEVALYNREDPFKKAIFEIGMWAIKVLVAGGAFMWAVVKFGGKS